MLDPLLDISDLASRLKIPAKTIRNKLSNGTWPIQPVRIGRALRWRETDVNRVIADLALNPIQAAELAANASTPDQSRTPIADHKRLPEKKSR